MAKERRSLACGLLVATLVACSGTPDEDTSPGDGATTNALATPKTPVGVYVPTFNSAIVGTGGNAKLREVLTAPNVDGFFVARRWRDVEPSEGGYDFSSLLADIRAVAAAGKKATVGIGAGILSPAYLCQPKALGGAGAACLSLVIHPPQATGACISETLPLPWDPVLQNRFASMVEALAHAILSDPVAATAVVDVKITGFNDRNEETILPSAHGETIACTTGDACVDGVCHTSDAVTALENAGYSDSSATAAILTFARTFRSAFKRTAIGAQVSPALPSPGSDNVHVIMDEALAADPSLRPLTAQNQGLSGTERVDQGLVAASEAGVPIGFQMLAYVAGNPTCLMGHGLGPDGGNAPCDESVLEAAIDHGIAMGARWLEIYVQDVIAYPDAIAKAHARLTSTK